MPKRRGRRGEGGLTQRPNGRWQAQVSTTRGGKRVRLSKTFELKSEAQWWKGQTTRLGRAPEGDTPLDDYLEGWLRDHRGVAASTRLQYENHVREHIVPALGGIPIDDLRPRDVERFMAELARKVSKASKKKPRPLSPSTQRAILVTLRSALSVAVKRGDIPDNPAASVAPPRVEREPVRAMTRTDAAALIEAVRGTWMEQIVRFLLGSGLRIGEAVALNRANVHDGWVELVKSKTTIRAVRVSEDGMAALREAMAQAPRVGPKEPVWFSPKPNRQGVRDRLSRHSLAHALPRHLESRGLGRLTPHSLRHGTATLMVAAGVHMRVVAEQLGHANPAMTARVYSHVAPESAAAAISVLDEAVKG